MPTLGPFILLQRRQLEAFELDDHGWTLMNLKRQEAFFRSVGRVFIRYVDGLHAIDEVLHMVAFGDDFVVVPVLGFDGGLDVGAHANCASLLDDWLFAIGTWLDDGLFAALS